MADFARYLNIRSALMPVLSPDGERAAFLTDISGNFQAWSAAAAPNPADPWPRQLTFFADKVWELHGTEQAGHLIAVGDYAGNERQQLYLISNYGAGADAAGGHAVRRLTQNDAAIHAFGAWSADGQEILYTSNARNDVDFDIYRMDLRDGEERRVCECAGRRSIVAWIGEGRYAVSADSVASEQIELYLHDLATGEQRHLTADRPPARYASFATSGDAVYLVTDRDHDRGAVCRLDWQTGALVEIAGARRFDAQLDGAAGEIELLAAAADGRTAAATVNVEGYSRLFLLDLQEGDLEPVTHLPDGVITHLSFGADGRTLAFDFQSPLQPADVWTLDVGSRSLFRLTHSDRAGIDSAGFVAPQLIRFTTFDGRSLPAFYYRPQTPPPDGGYPCILYVHGGPASQQRPDFDVRFQYFLSQGYALLVPNVRGSTGYGREYMMLDDVERRMDSVADLKAVVEWLHGRPEIAADRIAIYGRSYGGFMVLAALTEYPDLFAAGVDIVGIADWVTFLERTSPWRRAHREREYGSLAQHRDFLRRISPLHKAERIRAPLLVQAGDNDPRVPLYESQQIAERVSASGGTVEFVHYADEGHMFSKLENRIDSFTQMAEFLRRHIGGGRGNAE